MAQFSKLFPFLQRFHFPPQGEVLYPRNVDDEVKLTHELFRADIKHTLYLTSLDLSGAGAGVNITLNLIPEPAQGFVMLPYHVAVFQDGLVTPQRVQFPVEATGTPGPGDVATGIWSAALTSIYTIDLNEDHWVRVPIQIPMPRGNRLSALFVSVPIGTTVRTRSLCLQVPIETVDWTRMLTSGGHAHTGAA